MTQTPQQHFDAVASIMQDVKFTMLTTVTAEGHLHACPMTTNHVDLPAREIWFIGDKTTETVKDIQHNAQVNLSLPAQTTKTTYPSTAAPNWLMTRTSLTNCGHRCTARFLNMVKRMSRFS